MPVILPEPWDGLYMAAQRTAPGRRGVPEITSFIPLPGSLCCSEAS